MGLMGQAWKTNCQEAPPPHILTWGAISKVKAKSIDSLMLPAPAHEQLAVRPDCASQPFIIPLLRSRRAAVEPARTLSRSAAVTSTVLHGVASATAAGSCFRLLLQLDRGAGLKGCWDAL
jgi:hypothetical protein